MAKLTLLKIRERMESRWQVLPDLGKGKKKPTWNILLTVKRNRLIIRNMIKKCKYRYVNLLYYKQHSILHVLATCYGGLQGSVI